MQFGRSVSQIRSNAKAVHCSRFSFNSEELFVRNKKLLAEIPNVLDEVTETAEIIQQISDEDIEHAAAFFENQVFSFSSTGKSFAIARKDMTKRFPRLIAACNRLRDAIIASS